MKYFVISDVHSFYDPMKKALDDAGFDPKNKNHTLISLGDNFDRGDDTIKVWNYLKSLERKILIRGNHEDLLIDLINKREADRYDYSNGTVSTLCQLAGHNIEEFKVPYSYSYLGYAIPVAIYEKAKKTGIINYINKNEINYIEIGNYIFTHGWIPFDGISQHPIWGLALSKDWREITSSNLWENYRFCHTLNMLSYKKYTVPKDKILVVGHWDTISMHNKYDKSHPAQDSSIFYDKNFIGIDACTALTNKCNVFTFEDK